MHNYDERITTQILHRSGSNLPAQPNNQASREPAISSLTRDEIRRIVLDLIG